MAPNNWHTSKIEIHGQHKESFEKDFPAKRTGVDFINILQEAFTRSDPKRAKKDRWLDCIFLYFWDLCE